MRIEVLCEDKSSVRVLKKILGDILFFGREALFPAGVRAAAESTAGAKGFALWPGVSEKSEHQLSCNGVVLDIHPHRGKGYIPANLFEKPEYSRSGLLNLLPAKLRAYSHLDRDEALIVCVVLDSDDDDKDCLYQKIEALIRHCAPENFFVIGISVEEMEAWLLGDPLAIRQAFPEADTSLLKTYSQDSVCGTWELLAQIIEGREKGRELAHIGYPAVGIFKAKWAESIAPWLDPERNQSPSLKNFLDRFRSIVRLAAENDRSGRAAKQTSKQDEV